MTAEIIIFLNGGRKKPKKERIVHPIKGDKNRTKGRGEPQAPCTKFKGMIFEDIQFACTKC